MIATTRPIQDIETAEPLLNTFRRLEIYPLTFTQTLEFIKSICSKLDMTTRIIEDLKKSSLLKELPRSPISAILLAKILNENPNDLPSNMTELYSKFMELVLGRWDIEKGLESQKEYQALENILMHLSEFILENELPCISNQEAMTICKNYLNKRNLQIDGDKLFEKLIKRFDILSYDKIRKTIGFKHRTFAEFFYAKSCIREKKLEMEDKAFSIYWINIYFFYIGLLRDCPTELSALIDFQPNSDQIKLMKISSISRYLLAAYTTPYSIIQTGITRIMIEAASFYIDIIKGRIESPLQDFPQMYLLWIFQLFIRHNYSYSFFKEAIEDSVLYIDDDSELSSEIKAYAIFFLNVAYIDMTSEESFDFLLNKHAKNLPLDIELGLKSEIKHFKQKSILLKKQLKNLDKKLSESRSLNSFAQKLFETPISAILDKNKLTS